MADTVVHTYGIVPNRSIALPEQGIDRTRVRLLALDDELAVVVGDLDAAAYGSETWRQHGQDPRWLEPIATAHHAVLQALCEADDACDVLPLRLPGIYPDDASVREVFTRLGPELHRAFDAVRGQVEWGVKVYLTGAQAVAEEPRASTGREYLQRKSAAGERRAQDRERRQQLLAEAHQQLSEKASRSAVNDVLHSALTGREEPMVLNSAHLVPRSAESQFFAETARVGEALSAQGMTLELSGPWPPYNFVRIGEPTRSDA